jgi:hypothetical protein
VALPTTIPRRLALSALLTGALMYVACDAMYFTTAPKLISLLVEPFSLLLMPGLVVAIAFAGAHDFTPISVVCIAAAFYFGFFYCALWRVARAAQPATLQSASSIEVGSNPPPQMQPPHSR